MGRLGEQGDPPRELERRSWLPEEAAMIGEKRRWRKTEKEQGIDRRRQTEKEQGTDIDEIIV